MKLFHRVFSCQSTQVINWLPILQNILQKMQSKPRWIQNTNSFCRLVISFSVEVWGGILPEYLRWTSSSDLAWAPSLYPALEGKEPLLAPNRPVTTGKALWWLSKSFIEKMKYRALRWVEMAYLLGLGYFTLYRTSWLNLQVSLCRAHALTAWCNVTNDMSDWSGYADMAERPVRNICGSSVCGLGWSEPDLDQLGSGHLFGSCVQAVTRPTKRKFYWKNADIPFFGLYSYCPSLIGLTGRF